MRLRQVALVARELERSVEELCDVLGIEVAYNDPSVAVFGLVNTVMPFGETLLEVVSPAREGTTAGRYLERRGGDGGYMLILQTRDLGRERERIEKLGVRVVWEIDIGRAKVIHLHPHDIGSSLVSFDQMSEWDEWEWAGPDWRSKVRRDSTSGIVAAELQSEDPERCAAHQTSTLQVAAALRVTDVNLQAGAFNQLNREALVEAGPFIESVEELGSLVVNVVDGRIVSLSDVATLVDGPDEPETHSWMGFGPAAEEHAHTPKDQVKIDDLVRAMAFYAAFVSTMARK